LGTAAAGIRNVWSLSADTRERSWGKWQELVPVLEDAGERQRSEVGVWDRG